MIDSLLERAPAAGAAAQDPAERLVVRGHLPNPCSFARDDVVALGRRSLGPLEVRCFTGRHVADVKSMAGARLTDVLDAAGFSTLERALRKRCVIVATGGDGYLALFTWAELYNTAAGSQVLVLYERDGRPLDPLIGSFDLIAASDLSLGPRHLRGLRGIRIDLL